VFADVTSGSKTGIERRGMKKLLEYAQSGDTVVVWWVDRLGRSLDPDDFTDAQAIAAIERITRGNFRFLERLFPQIARVLKINDLETITDDVIEAAASVLVIGN
jgi:Resolvase, N terminal domain